MCVGISKVMVKIRPENKDQTFLLYFSVVLNVCNNDDQTLFFITLTFARSRTIENLCFWPLFSTAPSKPGKC